MSTIATKYNHKRVESDKAMQTRVKGIIAMYPDPVSLFFLERESDIDKLVLVHVLHASVDNKEIERVVTDRGIKYKIKKVKAK